jgi:Uma2 family endonuclease
VGRVCLGRPRQFKGNEGLAGQPTVCDVEHQVRIRGTLGGMSGLARDLRKNSDEVEAAYRAAPAECVAEILDGELHVQPRPRVRHSRAASRLGARLGGFDQDNLGGPSGWVILFGPELHLGPGPDKLVPDLAGWRRERLPELPDAAALELAPDWVCEVISERTEVVDRTKKRRIYAREGVSHLWPVSPEQRMLEVFRLERGSWVLVDTFEGDAPVRAVPFDAIELPLGRLWER